MQLELKMLPFFLKKNIFGKENFMFFQKIISIYNNMSLGFILPFYYNN